MTEPDWKAELRRQLEQAGEAEVRANILTYTTGGEDRRQFVFDWLRGEERARQKREARSYLYLRLTFLVALGALIASIVTIFVH